MPVFNLMVEDVHEFYANGILVHNCEWVPGEPSPDRLDSLVWGYHDLFNLGEEPPKDPSAGLILMDSTGGWNP